MILNRILNKSKKSYTQKNKSGFIDIHCHILPGVDDGAKDLIQAENMLKYAYKEGIRSIITTPHYKEKVFQESREILLDKLNRLKEYTNAEEKELTLNLGNEIYYSHESLHLLSEGVIQTLSKSRYVLVEFAPFEEYQYIKNSLQELILGGYWPILAHTERYESLNESTSRIKALTDMGVYHQINTQGILGVFGSEEKRRCKKLLRYQLVHFVATDAHNDTKRPPIVKKCFQYVARRYGENYAEALFIYNPKKVIEGKSLM